MKKLSVVLIVLLLAIPPIIVVATDFCRSPPYANKSQWENTGLIGYKECRMDVDPSLGIQKLYSYLYNSYSTGSYAESGGTFNDNPVPGNSPIYQIGPGSVTIRGRVSGEVIGLLKIYDLGELSMAEVGVYCTLWGSYDGNVW